MKRLQFIVTLCSVLVWVGITSAQTATPTQTPTNTQTPTVTQTGRAAITPNSGFTNSNPIGNPGQSSDVTATFTYVTGASLALWTNDVIDLVKLPKGAVITDYYIKVPDLDSGSGLTLDLGIASSPAIFLLDSTIGQAGGIVSPLNAPNGVVTGAVPASVLTANDILVLKATAPAAGAGAGGTLSGWVRYHMRGNAF